MLHPLPHKRFVALMEWPPQKDSPYGPLLRNVLNATGGQLARAESSTKDLLIISPGDVTGQAPPKSPSDAVGALGANLVLAASLSRSPKGVALSLKVLDAASQKVLREKELTAPVSDFGRLPDRAAAAGAKLLDVTPAKGQSRDPDDLSALPPAAYLAYTSAEDLIGRPNNTGLDEAVAQYQKALDLAPHFALAYARLSMAYIRKFLKSQDRAVLNLARRNSDLAMRYNPESPQVLLSVALVDVNSGRTQEAVGELERALGPILKSADSAGEGPDAARSRPARRRRESLPQYAGEPAELLAGL